MISTTVDSNRVRRVPGIRAGVCLAGMAGLAVLLTGCQSGGQSAAFEAAAAGRSRLVGTPAIDFTLFNQDDQPVSLETLRGKWVVLYFYPKDGTPGCTCQAKEFSQNFPEFQYLSAVVYGISPDTVASHREVSAEFQLRVPLLADPQREVMRAYGAAVDTPQGPRIIRSTVLIDPKGVIAYHWPEVYPEGHAKRVRDKLEELQAAWKAAK